MVVGGVLGQILGFGLESVSNPNPQQDYADCIVLWHHNWSVGLFHAVEHVCVVLYCAHVHVLTATGFLNACMYPGCLTLVSHCCMRRCHSLC
jgi:hypothetical protein